MKIGYGQIGVGHPHANKFAVYRDSDDYEIVGVAEPDEALRQQAERSDLYRDVRWLSVEQLLNEPGLQVVGVETQVADLLDTAEQCVAAGKHIHLDKPAGSSLPQFRRILDEAARQHLAVQMGYMYRYNPGIVLLRQFLERGWLGDPFELHAVMSKLQGEAERKELVEQPGGTMFELGGHLIDLVHGVLGVPDAVHPYARHSSAIDDGLLDNMLAVFEYPKATATVRCTVDEVEGGGRRHLVVCGSEGTFHIQPLDAPKALITLKTPRGKYARGTQEVEFPTYKRYVADAADLAHIVRSEKDADFSYDHDYTVQRSLLLASELPTE